MALGTSQPAGPDSLHLPQFDGLVYFLLKDVWFLRSMGLGWGGVGGVKGFPTPPSSSFNYILDPTLTLLAPTPPSVGRSPCGSCDSRA